MRSAAAGANADAPAAGKTQWMEPVALNPREVVDALSLCVQALPRLRPNSARL